MKKEFEIIRRIAERALSTSYDSDAMKFALKDIQVIAIVHSEFEEPVVNYEAPCNVPS